MRTRTSTLFLSAALAAIAGNSLAEAPTTIEYVGEATLFVPGTGPSAAPGSGRTNPLGHEVTGGSERVIDLTVRRAHVNVTAGEIVKFKLEGREVVWDFDTLGTPVFALSRIIPGANPAIRVYVAPDRAYEGS